MRKQATFKFAKPGDWLRLKKMGRQKVFMLVGRAGAPCRCRFRNGQVVELHSYAIVRMEEEDIGEECIEEAVYDVSRRAFRFLCSGKMVKISEMKLKTVLFVTKRRFA